MQIMPFQSEAALIEPVALTSTGAEGDPRQYELSQGHMD